MKKTDSMFGFKKLLQHIKEQLHAQVHYQCFSFQNTCHLSTRPCRWCQAKTKTVSKRRRNFQFCGIAVSTRPKHHPRAQPLHQAAPHLHLTWHHLSRAGVLLPAGAMVVEDAPGSNNCSAVSNSTNSNSFRHQTVYQGSHPLLTWSASGQV